MEKMATTAFVNSVVGPLRLLADRFSMLMSVKDDSVSMGHDLIMLASFVDDQRIPKAWGDELRELTHDMEDCIERFLHRVSCAEGSSRARRLAYGLRTAHIRYRFATEMRALKRRLIETRNRWSTYQSQNRDDADQAQSCRNVELNRVPVGIEPAKRELLTMLEESPAELRVVAIVGFDGSGKTTLAKAVFNCPVVEERFGFRRAWVDQAKDKDAREILQLLLQIFGGQVRDGLDLETLAAELNGRLKSDRYLIIIDDIGEGQWNTIKWIFEDNSICNSEQKDNSSGSRIIVTTSIRSEANRCRNGNGLIYQMQNLGHQDCVRIALGEAPPPELLEHSAELLKKCDGHPLSLRTVANHLAGQNVPLGQFCEQMSLDLGSLLDNHSNFKRLKGVCMDNYTSMPNHTVRACFLYLSIFPNDVPLEREVIIRRWLAEGYARSANVSRDQSVAEANFEAFVDRNILHPIFSICNNAEVKTCKTRGIVREFLLHKSIIHEQFIMSFHDNNNRGRHLSIDHRSGENGTTTSGTDLSCVRSLTVFGSAGDVISKFRKYKILRVLDLEKCSDVTDKDLKHICKLWNLRYLSLGSKITKIPKDVARLKLLETLCLRKTKVDELPVQVIGLPCLLHLIGKFKIEDHGCRKSELIKLSRMSKLETLSGFIADESQEFLEVLLGNIRTLKKVKIWCHSGEDGSILPAQLSEAIQKYMGHNRSLSIHIQGFSGTFLISSLRAPCYLSSLKLKLHGGDLNTISPEFVRLFTALTEVCLSSTIVTQDLLTSLSGLKFLLYVKLIAAASNEELAVQNGAFPSLRRLCFEAPLLLTIEEGALQKLVSLQLLCRYVEGLAGIEIKHLVSLGEVTLDSNVRPETKSIWEEEASRHPNRPKILYDSHHENF